ncbi:MAG TPA: ROK family transcriptional regulator [Trueperaceae bacterium]
MSVASNATTVRDANRAAVLERIRLRAPVTRAEIARDTGLTPAAVSNIVGGLIAEGWVVETGRRPLERGQPPVELDLAASAVYSVGLHLDRDLISAVLVDLKGSVVHSVGQEIAPPDPEEALELLRTNYGRLLAGSNVSEDKILGAGVVTVGPLDLERGTVRGPPNFPGWHDVPLRDLLAGALGLPVILENNATAAAIGEHWYGAGRHHSNFLYVYIGLGVGGGLFFNNRVYRGSGLNAGEFGHLPLRLQEGTVPLESRTSILALRRELGEGQAQPEAIAAGLARRDPALVAWFERAAGYLAEAVAGVDNLLDLDAIVFGGRHSREVLEYLVARVADLTAPLRMPNRPSYAMIKAGRAGDDTAALGAAALPLYDAFAALPQAVAPGR